MTGHAHEFTPHSAPPAAICPGIEVLVHRRATELIAERPRRRILALSSVGGVAIATVCAVLVLAIGSPSGSGLLSPRQAVAAVVQSLDGNGVLHWVTEGDLIASPDQLDRPGTVVVDEWTDLATGNLRRVTTQTPRDGQPKTRTVWKTPNAYWFAVPSAANGGLTIKREFGAPSQQGMLSASDEVRALLQRGEDGMAEIVAGGEDRGRPLVVVTEREGQIVRRVWITRDGDPEVVRSETFVPSQNAPRPIVTTTTTKTWQILPRTPEALTNVEIPSDAKRVP